MSQHRSWIAIMAVVLGAALSAAGQTTAPDGRDLFQKNCATCHTGAADSHAPSPEILKDRAPESIVFALTGGTMRIQGAHISGEDRRAIAEYLTGKEFGPDSSGDTVGRCTANSPFANPFNVAGWNGWSPTIANTHFQPGDQAKLTAADVPKLKLKWAFGFADTAAAWAQVTVVGGRLFVGSQNAKVYSLDAKTGCIYWAFGAEGSVRTAVTVGARKSPGGAGFSAYFSDMRGNVYAVDAATGNLIWKKNIESHPMVRLTGAPKLYDGRLYVPAASFEETSAADPTYACCSFSGSVTAMDARTGAIYWKTYTLPKAKVIGKSPSGGDLWGPSGGGVWTSPTIDAKRGVFYIGVGNSYSGEPQPITDSITAISMKTGKIVWSNQTLPKDIFIGGCRPGAPNPNCPPDQGPDFDFGATPALVTLASGKNVIIAGQKSGVVYGLDPDKKGAVIWQYHAGGGDSGLGGIEWGLATDAEKVYIPVSDIIGKHPGGLHAINLATGERVWYTPPPPAKCGRGPGCNAAQPGAISVIPGVVFSGSIDGELRAFSTEDGSIVWDFDTNRNFQTLNGVTAKGASLNGGAPIIVNGMVYVSSGYGYDGGRPGNVLLAFGTE